MKMTLWAVVALLSSYPSFHLCASSEWKSKVEIGQGYRRDRLKFNFSGYHHVPNIISELKFTKMDVYLTTLNASLSNGTYIGSLNLAYGDICHGRFRDSDYFKNNKRGEFSRSIGKVPGRYTVDASAKIGRHFSGAGLTFTPSLGYGVFWQHLRMRDGRQVIPKSSHLRKISPIHHLNSRYKTVWSAPFVDLRFAIPVHPRLSLELGYMFFYPVKYTGKGNWNLRHLRFTQKNRVWQSYGERADVALRWTFADRFELGLGAALARFVARKGTVSFRQMGNKGRQPANRAKRTYPEYVLTLSYSF